MPVVIALPELLALAGLFLALGMVVMGDQFTKALFQVTESGIGWIPWVGKKAANGVHAVGKRVNAVFSSAALQLEGAISSTWHVFANLIEQTGEAIWDATQVGARALWLVEVKYPLDALSFLAHKGVQAAGVGAKVTNITVQKVYQTGRIAKAQLVRANHRLDALEARVHATAIALPGAISIPFPRIGALERAWHGTQGRLGKLEHRFGRTAFAASVATALAALGVGWARRSCAKRTADGFCRVDPDVFAGLIAGLAVVVGAQSVVRFANGMIAVEDEFVGVLERMIVELGDAAE